MPPVLAATRSGDLRGYRRAGRQHIRVDLAEKLLRSAHQRRVATPRRHFALDPAVAISMGLTKDSYTRLLREAGFRPIEPPRLAPDMFGPPIPRLWRWRPLHPPQRQQPAPPARPANPQGAFAQLADWGR